MFLKVKINTGTVLLHDLDIFKNFIQIKRLKKNKRNCNIYRVINILDKVHFPNLHTATKVNKAVILL